MRYLLESPYVDLIGLALILLFVWVDFSFGVGFVAGYLGILYICKIMDNGKNS